MPTPSTASKLFFDKYHKAAIEATAGSKIFPETVLSAAALESGNGTSSLTKNYNNFFGIKAGSTWKGKVVNLSTPEQSQKHR